MDAGTEEAPWWQPGLARGKHVLPSACSAHYTSTSPNRQWLFLWAGPAQRPGCDKPICRQRPETCMGGRLG